MGEIPEPVDIGDINSCYQYVSNVISSNDILISRRVWSTTDEPWQGGTKISFEEMRFMTDDKIEITMSDIIKHSRLHDQRIHTLMRSVERMDEELARLARNDRHAKFKAWLREVSTMLAYAEVPRELRRLIISFLTS